MAIAPGDDVDPGIGRLRAEAARAKRRIGLRTAVHAVDAEEQDRRACERKVVRGVAIGNVERGERLENAVATTGDVVEVDDIDAKSRANPADERRPRLAIVAGEIEGAHGSVVLVRLELPTVADRDGEVVAIPGARRIDQRARVMLGAAAVPVDHMEDAAIGARDGAASSGTETHVASVAPVSQRCSSRTRPISRVSPVTTSGRSTWSNSRTPSGSSACARMKYLPGNSITRGSVSA